MKYLIVLLVIAVYAGAQVDGDDPAGEPMEESPPAQQPVPTDSARPGISPFFRVGAGLGVQIHRGGTWRNPWGSETEWHGGEWEGFNACVSNVSMGILIDSSDLAMTLDNTTAWFNTQGFWGDDPFMASSVTAIMGTYYPSPDWSVGGGAGLFLLGTPFNDNGTLSGPAGMISAGRRVSEDVFVEGRFFVGLIQQGQSLMSDAKTVIGINVVVNSDLVF